MKKPIKKIAPKKKSEAIKKAAFDASPVSRKAVDAIKAKLRKVQDKKDATKIARTELAAEKKALQQKAKLKASEAIYKKSKRK